MTKQAACSSTDHGGVVLTGSPCRKFPATGPKEDPNPPLELLRLATPTVSHTVGISS
jgi:hypothetical protein